MVIEYQVVSRGAKELGMKSGAMVDERSLRQPFASSPLTYIAGSWVVNSIGIIYIYISLEANEQLPILYWQLPGNPKCSQPGPSIPRIHAIVLRILEVWAVFLRLSGGYLTRTEAAKISPRARCLARSRGELTLTTCSC